MRLCLTVLLCSVFALGRAVACSGPDPLIVDDFSGANRSSWDNQGPVVAIDSQYGSPALTIRPHSHRLAYSLFTPRATGPRAMICTRVRSHGSTGSAGIVFWHAGDDEYYVARFDFSSGKAVVDHRTAGGWVPMLTVAAPSLSTAPNAVNELEIRTSSTQAELWVNGTWVQAVRGTAPADGGKAGLVGENDTASDDGFSASFGQFAVFRPAPPANNFIAGLLQQPQPGGCARPGASATDDFGSSKPRAWDNLGKAINIDQSAHRLLIEPSANKLAYTVFQQKPGLRAAACARVQFSGGPGRVGLVFWWTRDEDYYSATIDTGDGTLYVHRRVNGNWSLLKEAFALTFSKLPNATNELEARMTPTGAEFWINGGRVTEINGTPPADGGSVGLLAENDVATDRAFTAAFSMFALFGSSAPSVAGPTQLEPVFAPTQPDVVDVTFRNDYFLPIVTMQLARKGATVYGPNQLQPPAVIYELCWKLGDG